MSGRPSGGRSPKRRRLSRSAEFERVYRQGRSKGNRFLVLYAFPREEDETRADDEGPRLGLSVSRRVGGAVDRTHVKRVLREAFWAEATRLPAELFYQTSPGQLENAVATHHAAGSWKTIESYRNAVKLAEQRNYELRGRIEELERELAKTQGKRRFLTR